ncbi:sugar transferase [Candidatus Paracaedibacter symbiosus]|uniref:sugar transferase n=1 Tax=Candidatus Paracaedibacter symbiosus TaxID=244582 RepID=UPI001E405AAA|nr:sugar transferase [Candidatus Paracaedibacter symbiosus]
MMLKRIIDIILASIALLLSLVPILLIALAVKLTSKGSVFFTTQRLGLNHKPFSMPKFRTMYVGTPIKGTHEFKNATQYITPIGSFLRRTSLDELPQLFSVLKGDMSLVGPRPSLPNEDLLNQLRYEHKVHELLPGITGWAQINGRDSLSIEQKVHFDAEYRSKKSIILDLKIIVMTILLVLNRQGIRH